MTDEQIKELFKDKTIFIHNEDFDFKSSTTTWDDVEPSNFDIYGTEKPQRQGDASWGHIGEQPRHKRKRKNDDPADTSHELEAIIMYFAGLFLIVFLASLAIIIFLGILSNI